MTLVTDSPVHSSSSDDFASFLDTHIAAGASDSSENEDSDGEVDLEKKR